MRCAELLHAWPTTLCAADLGAAACAQYVFMDTTTYDETRLKKDEDWAKYLKEGSDVNLLLWKGRVISVDPPTTVELEVVETEPNVKGNTVSGTLPCAHNIPLQCSIKPTI